MGDKVKPTFGKKVSVSEEELKEGESIKQERLSTEKIVFSEGFECFRCLSLGQKALWLRPPSRGMGVHEHLCGQ